MTGSASAEGVTPLGIDQMLHQVKQQRTGRSIATVEVRRDPRLLPIHGSSLARLGVTAELASGSSCAGSQLWSRALWEHSDQPDGILYRPSHDAAALCVALYDRAKDGLAIVRDHSLAEDPQPLARLLRRYGLGLTNWALAADLAIV